MRVKRLDVPTYISFALNHPLEDDIVLQDLPEISPIIGKNGWYYDRDSKSAWFEYKGRAFVDSSPDMFLYELSLENHRPLSIAERTAILILIRNRRADRKLKDLYYLDEQWRQLRQVVRESAYHSYKFFKQFRDEKLHGSG